ncbi:DMT family transporter [Marinactinospora thermotolerans]|uniref:DMT family transporter n=1 Tax=Marinactinospora thermotolerans TaxID=531310 RepID=UPI003D949D59
MAWILLIIAGLLETVFAIALKMSEGFTRLWPTVTFVAAAAASFTLLSLSLRSLPVGTAYAVWTGLGASGTAVFGMMFLGDPVQVLRIVAIVLILAGVVALQLAGGGAH